MQTLTDWSGLGGLYFVARRLVEGLYAGRHFSPLAGAGLDFFDYRAYCPGDDIGELDWKLLGRTDRYYVRRYRRHTDLHAYVLVDVSASMHFAGLDRYGTPYIGPDAATKLRYAGLLASAIAFLTIRQSDRAGLGLFADKLVAHLPPGGTPAHLQRICATLEKAAPRPGQGDVGAGLAQAHKLLRRRGLVVVISDLLDEPGPFFDGLNMLRHDGFDAIVFQVLSPQELDLAELGPLRLRLIDSENRKLVQTQVSQVQRRYGELLGAHLETLRAGCVGRGIDYNLLSTDDSIVRSLRQYLVRRSALRGETGINTKTRRMRREHEEEGEED